MHGEPLARKLLNQDIDRCSLSNNSFRGGFSVGTREGLMYPFLSKARFATDSYFFFFFFLKLAFAVPLTTFIVITSILMIWSMGLVISVRKNTKSKPGIFDD